MEIKKIKNFLKAKKVPMAIKLEGGRGTEMHNGMVISGGIFLAASLIRPDI